jgi:hypothetical protein
MKLICELRTRFSQYIWIIIFLTELCLSVKRGKNRVYVQMVLERKEKSVLKDTSPN